MKKIELFIMRACPHCKKALRELDELMSEERFKDVKIEIIDENEQPEIANSRDYYYVPTFYLDNEKVHEGIVEGNTVKNILERSIS